MAAALLLGCVATSSLLLPVATQSYYSAPYASHGNGDVYVTQNSDVASAGQPQILGYGVSEGNDDLYGSNYQVPAAFLEAVQGLFPQQNLIPKQGSGYTQQQPSGYQSPNSYSSASSVYGPKKTRKKKKKQHKKKIYVPVPIKTSTRKKKKKKKTISVSKGFFVHGGSLIFGKFKTLKACQKACDNTASCFAGDYDKWTRRCYAHTNSTACGGMTARKGTTHFKKVPCSLSDIGLDFARITLGANLDHGLLQKGIKNIQSCIRKCAEAGGGVLPVFADAVDPQLELLGRPQVCFGIDYDFATHKCYFHTSVNLFTTDAMAVLAAAPDVLQGVLGGIRCFVTDNNPTRTTALGPENLVANPSSINIVICPRPLTG